MRISFAAGAVAALVLASCSKPEPIPPPEPTPDRAASTLSADPASGVLADGEAQATVTVTVIDTEGAPMAGAEIVLSATGEGSSVVQPAAPTDASGVALGYVRSARPGTANVSATATWKQVEYKLSTQARVDFVPGPAARLVFAVPPSSAKAGATIAPEVRVAVQDALGNTLFDSSAEITLALGANPVGGVLSGTTVAAAASGVATFADLSIEKAGTGYTVVASASGLTSVTSAEIEISVAAPSRLAFLVGPATASAGVEIAPAIQVAVQDPLGNLIPTATDVISLALGANPTQGTLSGTQSVKAIGGVATFSNLKIDKAGSGYTLAATTRLLAGTTSEPFDVAASTATRLVFVGQPSAAIAGAAISPAVRVAVEDDFGNRILATPAVTLALATNAAGAVLGGTVTATAVDGVATFDTLTVERAARGYSLIAAASDLAGASSATFEVTPALPTTLVFEVQPRSTSAGSAISPAVEVSVRDDFGNRVTSAEPQITLALDSNPGNSVLQGTVTARAFSGLARFSNLIVEETGSAFTLVATAAGLTSPTSTAFDVTSAAATQIAFVVEPSATAAGAAFAPAVEVELLDSYGNRVVDATDTVTIKLGANPGNSALLGTTSVSAVAGVARFADLHIDKVAVGYTLSATSGRLTITSAPFPINAASPAKLAWVQQPSTVTAATAIAPAPSLEVLDAFGNRVPNATNAVTLTLQPGTSGAALTGTSTVPAASGVATFSGLKVDKKGTAYSLLASAAGLASAQSATFAVNPGAPASIAFKVQPPLSATVNTPLAPAVEVSVVDAGGNLVPAAVTMALGANPSVATLGGARTVDAVSGVAIFSDLTVSKAGVGYTLAASVAGTGGATSTAFNVQVGGPTKLAFSAQPTNVVAGVAIAPTVQVLVLDQWGNVVLSATGAVTIAADPSSPGPASGTLTATPVNGVASFSNLILEKVGTYKLIASSPALTDGASVNFTVSVAPPSASASTVTVDPAAGVVADGIGSSTITVTVRDAFSNPISGAAVALAALPATGNTFSTLALTDASGVTSATLKSTKAEIKTLTATVDGPVVIGTHPTITFVAGAPSASLSTVSVNPATGVTADGADLSTITVTVLDAKSNPVPGAAVAITASPTTGNTLSALPPTGLDGVSLATIASTKAEVKTLTTVVTVGATNTTLTSPKPTVTFVPGAPSKLVWQQQPTTVISATAINPAPRLAVLDAFDNFVPNATNAVTVAMLGGAAGATLSGTTTISATSGVASFSTLKVDKAASGYSLLATASGLVGSQSSTFDVTIGAPASLAFKVQPSASTVSTALSPAIEVEVRDAGGNLVLNPTAVTIALGTNPSAAILNGTRTVNSASGVAVFSDLTLSKIGVGYKLSASATGTPGVTSNAFDVGVDVPARLAFSAQPTNVVAGVAIAPAVQVLVLDQWGNIVPSATAEVTLAADAANPGPASGTLTATPVDGVATFSNVILEKMGTYKLIASSPGLENGVSVNFTVSVASPNASTSTVEVSPAANVIADGTTPSTITVTVRDAFSNPIFGAAVVLAALPTTGNTITTPVATNALGVTSATLKSTKAEIKTITATVGGSVVIAMRPTITFVPGAPSASLSTTTASPSTVTADGGTVSTITVKVLDAKSNPIPGAAVAISAAPTTGNTLSAVPATGLDGVSVATIVSTKAEVKTLTTVVTVGATNTTLTSPKPTITFVAGPPNADRSSVAVSAASLIAGATTGSTITVTVRDTNDNPVPGIVVVLEASPADGNTLVQPAANTTAAGVATGNLKSTKAEAKTVTATAGGVVLTDKPTVTILPAAVSPGVSTAVASPASGVTADGVEISTVTITALDAFSNPVPGAAVAITALPITGNTISSALATGLGGVTTATIKSTKAETKTITAVVTVGATNTTVTVKPTVLFVPGPVSPTISTVTAAPASATANDLATSIITVTVRDAQGNPIPGAAVELASDGSGNTISAPAATAPTGITTATIKSTRAELKTITALVTVGAASTLLADEPTISFVPGLVSPTVSTVTAAPPIVSADGASVATITVTALDAYSNPVPAQPITLAVSGTLNTVPAPAATAADGTSTTTLASTKAEVKTISAKIGTVSIAQTASVEFKSLRVNETKSTLVVSPTTNPVANDVETRTITATLRDINGNPVTAPAVEVFFSSTDADDVIEPASVFSDAVTGVATATIRSTKAGAKTLSAVADSLTIAHHPIVTFVAGPPSASRSAVTVDPVSVVADNLSTTTVTVVIRDAFDNLVPGRKPTLTATGSTNTFVQPLTTGVSGTVTGTLKSSKAEAKTITATLDTTPALVLDLKPVVTFIPGQVSPSLSTFIVSRPTGVVADGIDSSTVTVTLKDAASNLIPGTPVAFSATGAGNSFPTSVTTDANGVAVAYLASTVAETETVSIVANGIALTTTKTVGFIAGAPSMANSAFTASPANVTADGVATSALLVTVRDAHDNLVPAAAVSLRSTGSLNKFTPVSGATTTGGVFGATLSSTMAEQKQLLASVGGFTLLSQVTFGYTLPQIKSLSVAAGGGCVAINYAVQQSQAKRVDVLVEYDPTSSGTFARATQAGSITSDGIEQVTTLAAVGGQGHSFLWNSTADLPRRAVTSGRVRVTPYINGQAGISMTQTIASLSNALTFGSSTGVPAGGHPGAVAQADFNRDGKLDLVTANPGDDKIYVLLGNGSGGFGAAKPFAAQQPPISPDPIPPPLGLEALAAADLDGDGDLDLAVATSPNTLAYPELTPVVVLFLNNGAGEFALPAKGELPEPPPRPSFALPFNGSAIVAADLDSNSFADLAVSGTGGVHVLLDSGATATYLAGAAPSALAVADVSGDSKLDLLVANAGSDDLSVLLGAGGGAFGAAVSYPVGAGPSSLTAADLDADGDLDVAVANRTANTMSILLGTGAGGFLPGTALTTGIGPASVSSEDLDGDGRIDLVVANETENTLGVHLGNGDGTFAASAKPVASGQPESLVVGDYNRDGKPDLAAAAWFGNVVDVLLNTRPRRCDPGLVTATNAPLGASPQAIAGGDFNGDGKADLAVIDGSDGAFEIHLGTGNGGYRAPLSTSIPGGGGSHFVAADLNGDGKLDVATPAETGANFFPGAGSGLFSAPVATAGGTFPTSLAAGDFNGDDKLDVVTMMETNGLVSVFLMNGAVFAPPVHLAIGGQPQSATVGDFDRDGKRDLAVVNLAQVAVLRGNGDGTFGAPVYVNAGTAPRFVLSGDFDRDGELDLVVANRDSADVSILLGNGDATFAPAVSNLAGAAPRWLSIDDLDGNATLDLLVGFETGQAAKVLLGLGDGTFQAATAWNYAATPIAVTSADFDADGKKDLAAAVNSPSPRLTTLRGKGDGTFPALGSYSAGANPHALCSADFDRDGALDLAVSALFGDQMSLLLGTGSGTFLPTTPTSLDGPGASIHADLDRDGLSDLLVASGVTGRLSVLLGNGDGSFMPFGSHSFPGSSPSPSALAAGDFDRDGALDVVVANGAANLVCFFWGNGSGGLTVPSLAECKVVGDGPTSIALGDFDKNGTLDVATANGPHNSVGVLLGYGDSTRTFQPLRSFAVGAPLDVVSPVAVVAADLNGDGNLDLATANNAGDSLGVLLGLGTGSFSPVVFYPAPGEPTALFAADLDDDGKSDLLAPIRGSGVAIFSGSGTGTLLTPIGWYLDAHAYTAADFNRDGRLDFAFANTDTASAGVCIGK